MNPHNKVWYVYKYWLQAFSYICYIYDDQFSSYLFESYADYLNEDGKREIKENLSLNENYECLFF